MAGTISFKVTREESLTIDKIVKRAIQTGKAAGIDVDAMTMHMDISACHCNGCLLKLADLLAADDFNFSHDVFGIRRHIDRKTGQLGDCFVPRYAEQQ